MSVTIQRPSGVNVGVNNPRATLYCGNFIDENLPSDGDTDGSLRFSYTFGETAMAVEFRENGVWNDYSFRTASGSNYVGRDMVLSASAGFLQTENLSNTVGHQLALIPHVEFDEESTTQQAHSPQINLPETFDIYTDPVSEVTSTMITQVYNISPSRRMINSTFKVGSIVPTAQVTHRYYVGTDNTGALFHEDNYPASAFVANSDLILDYNGAFGFEESGNYFMELESTSSFSMQTDVSGNLITSHFAHEIKEVDILLDQLVLSNDLSITFDNDLNWVVGNQF